MRKTPACFRWQSLSRLKQMGSRFHKARLCLSFVMLGTVHMTLDKFENTAFFLRLCPAVHTHYGWEGITGELN